MQHTLGDEEELHGALRRLGPFCLIIVHIVAWLMGHAGKPRNVCRGDDNKGQTSLALDGALSLIRQ